MSDTADKAVDQVIAFWQRFCDQYRAEADALGVLSEQGADALLSAAIGAKIQVSGEKETARTLYLLAQMAFQAGAARDLAAAAAADSSKSTKH